MEKEDIIKNILSVCNDMGVSFHKKVKTDKWKADIVVDYQNYKVAFPDFITFLRHHIAQIENQ